MALEISQKAVDLAYRDVEEISIVRTEPRERPIAIVLGGQPGAGKAALASVAAQELKSQGGAVVIDADRMREENPRYKQLSISDPQHAADRTHKEAGEWSIQLTRAAVEARRNLVIDGTMRSPEAIDSLTSQLKKSGYTVEARVLAVNPDVSLTRARLRYEEQVSERGTGRFVNKDQHDAAYAGMLQTVRAIEDKKSVDSLRVFNASQQQIYSNQVQGGKWLKEPQAAGVIATERGRQWTHFEHRDHVTALGDIQTLAAAREGIKSNVKYVLTIPDQQRSQEFGSALEAAKAFQAVQGEKPAFIERQESMLTGRVLHTTPGSIEQDKGGQSRHVIDNSDMALKAAWREVAGGEGGMVRDLPQVSAQLAKAAKALEDFERTPQYQRANAFDALPKKEALARYPELDGAFKALYDLKQSWAKDGSSQDFREKSHFMKRVELSDQLHRGQIPQAPVTKEDSAKVIALASEHRGLILRDGSDQKAAVHGEVIAASSHHVLVQMSDRIAVRYDREALSREVHQGEKLQFAPAKEAGRMQVMDATEKPQREQLQDQSRDRGGR